MNNDSKLIPEIFLHPGEFHLSTSSTIITTVLGSCVSVIMYDTNNQLSMMSHNIMPSCNNPKCKGDCRDVHKYAECTVKRMVKIFDSAHIPRKNIIVKLFGGSELMNLGGHGDGLPSIGSRNIEAAKKIIENEELRLIAHDLGGEISRKIIFVTNTGEVFLSRTKHKKGIDKKHGKN